MHTKKYAIHGVTRLINAGQLAQYVRELEWAQAYIITTESKGEKTEHVHFLICSDSRDCNRTRFRGLLKTKFSLKITTNGELNLDVKVKDQTQCLIYLCKEGYPEYVHGYPTDFVKDCSRKSYSKKVSMTVAIKELMCLVIKGQLTPIEYVIKYRMVRIKYHHPDPYWTRQFENATEMQKTEDQIREEVLSYSKLNNNLYT